MRYIQFGFENIVRSVWGMNCHEHAHGLCAIMVRLPVTSLCAFTHYHVSCTPREWLCFLPSFVSMYEYIWWTTSVMAVMSSSYSKAFGSVCLEESGGICERKTLFRMKKETDQAGFKGTRTGPLVYPWNIISLYTQKTNILCSCVMLFNVVIFGVCAMPS